MIDFILKAYPCAIESHPMGFWPVRMAPRLARNVTIALASLVLSGCAGWAPWKDPAQIAKNQEKYGLTADQRIKMLEEKTKVCKANGVEQQEMFTQDLIQKMLEEHDPRVRCAILDAAADFNDSAALAICRGSLDDPDPRVRVEACRAWRKRGGEEAVTLLAARYQADTELDVRLESLRMLGELKDKSAIPVLAKALEDADPAVQYRAVGSLKKVSGQNLGDDVNKWREWAADPNAKTSVWSTAEIFKQIF